MSQFTDQQRQFVQDTNQGAIVPEEKTVAREVGSKSPLNNKTEFATGISSRSDHALTTMLGLAEPTINKRVEENINQRVAEGYATKDAKEALDAARDEQGIISKTLFGPSPEMRGLQKQVIETENAALYSQMTEDARTGITDNLSADDWLFMQEELLKTRLDKFDGEPEIRAEIISAHNKAIARAAPIHAVANETWKQNVAAGNFVNKIQATAKDVVSVPEDTDNMVGLMAAFNPVMNQTDEAWEKSTVETLRGLILDDVPGVFEAFKDSPHWDRLSTISQNQVLGTNTNKVMSDTTEGLKMRQALRDSIMIGDVEATGTAVDAMNELLPNDQQIDRNAEIMKAEEQERRIRAQALADEEKKQKALTGNAKKTADYDAALMDMATSAFKQDMTDEFDSNPDWTMEQYDAVISNGPPEDFVNQWIRHNPDVVSGLSVENHGVTSDLVRRAMVQPLAQMYSVHLLDQNDPKAQAVLTDLSDSAKFIAQIAETSPEIARAAGGTSEQYQFLQRLAVEIDAGSNLAVVMDDVRSTLGQTYNLDANYFTTSKGAEVLANMGQYITDEVDGGLFGTGWWQSINADEYAKEQLQQEYRRAYEATGDHQRAGQLAVNNIKRNSVNLGGVAHMGLGDLSTRVNNLGLDTNLEDYIEYMVTTDRTYAEAFRKAGFQEPGVFTNAVNWDMQGLKFSEVGDRITVTIPGTGQFATPTVIDIPIPRTPAEARGMTKIQYNKTVDRNNNPQKYYPQARIGPGPLTALPEQ